MLGLYSYYNEVVRPILISQYHYSDVKEVPEISYVKVGIAFNNLTGEEDWRITTSLKLLSKLTGRKASVEKLGWSVGGGKERRMCFVSSVTLRKQAAYNFLEYLIYVVFPLHCRRFGWPSLEISENGVYNCVFTDNSVFYRQQEDLIGFGGNVTLAIVTTAKNKEEGMSLLRNMGIPVLEKKEK